MSVEIFSRVLLALLVVTSALSLVFLWWFRKKPIVAMGQPRVLSVLCFGIMISVCGSIAGTLPRIEEAESRVSISLQTCCDLELWLTCMGTYTVTAIVVCKLYRVYKVVQVRRHQTVRPWQVIGPFFFVLLVPLGIVTANQILAPVLYNPPSGGTNGYCDWYYNSVGTTICYIEVAYHYMLELAVLAFAWKLRKVPEEIGESRRIFRLSCFLAILETCIFVTIVCMLHTDWIPEIRSVIIFDAWAFLFGMSIMVALIGPRMYYVFYERRNGRLPGSVQMIGQGEVHVNKSSTTDNRDASATSVPGCLS